MSNDFCERINYNDAGGNRRRWKAETAVPVFQNGRGDTAAMLI
jgi:hypothetical protein